MKNKPRLQLNRNRQSIPVSPELPDVNLDVINKIEELDDGSSVYEVGGRQDQRLKDDKFHANLAVNMKEGALKKLSEFLLSAIDDDIESIQPWLYLHNKFKKYTGYNGEDLDDKPF